MTKGSELALAQKFLDWLRGHVADAASENRTLAVFHYSSPEPAHLKKILGGEAVADACLTWIDGLPLDELPSDLPFPDRRAYAPLCIASALARSSSVSSPMVSRGASAT